MNDTPLVFVATPVFNGEKFIAECIESVIHQTYTNWIYRICDNCSTDSSLEIARYYASKDPRISVHCNTSFVGSEENHNIAVRLITPESKYCKVVSADDWLFPECLARMVELAERHPSVGIVGSYQLSGQGDKWQVRWDEIAYPGFVVPGREICRSHLLGGPYVFGTPTSSLYRADLVRSRDPFFPHQLPHTDTSACYECLKNSDFGFVHQVLSYERIHEQSVSAQCRKLRTNETILLRNLLSYGHWYLTDDEYNSRLKEVLEAYYKALAVGLFNGRGGGFWRYHIQDLAELGYRCFGIRLARAVFGKFLDLALNPKQTIEKIIKRSGIGRTPSREFIETAGHPSLTDSQADLRSESRL